MVAKARGSDPVVGNWYFESGQAEFWNLLRYFLGGFEPGGVAGAIDDDLQGLCSLASERGTLLVESAEGL